MLYNRYYRACLFTRVYTYFFKRVRIVALHTYATHCASDMILPVIFLLYYYPA